MSMYGDSRNDVRCVSYGNIGLQIGQKRGNMNEAQQAQQCHHNEFSITPYGAMQLMVENGCELEAIGPHRNVDRFRWCKVAGTFQVKVPDGWDPIGVAVILRRTFRMIERKDPRTWVCNKFPVHPISVNSDSLHCAFAIVIDCKEPPSCVSYVITEVL